MNQIYKIGDIVTLKSGGPRMTISNDKTGIGNQGSKFWNGRYYCQWFENDKIQTGIFIQEVLKLA